MPPVHDYVIDNSTGANVRADINSVLQAILTNNSSSSAPSTTAAYMFWADTTSGTLKIRNSSDNAWVELLQLDGTLTLEDGSASTPALAFRDDLNTGIFSSAADKFNVATGGVERMELGATTIFNEDGADVDFRIEGDTEVNLFYVDAGNGRIGIRTNTPSYPLHVNSGAANSVAIFESTDTGVEIEIKDSTGTSFVECRNDFRLKNSSGEMVRIDSSGNVGIGTTSPSGKLDIVTGANGGNVLIDAESSSGYHAKIVNDSGDLILGSRNTSGDTKVTSKRILIFNSGSSETERMRLLSDGPLLLNCTSVIASNTNTRLQVAHGSSGNGTPSVVIKNSGGSGQRNLIEFVGASSDNQVGLIHHNNSTTTYGTGSDYRLKENVVNISDGITRLKQLLPKRFNWIADETNTLQDGFIAHELQEVVPEAAYGTKDAVDNNGNPVYQGIDPSKVVPLLTAALKESIQKIEVLETKVAALEAA